jgi:hypothetical protein
MNVLEFNRRFMHLEEELDLFPDTARMPDPGWWDVVRHDVMKLVYNRLAGVGSEALPPVRFATSLRHLGERLLLRAALEIRLRPGRYDVLVYRAPRLTREGRRVDTALDQVLATCPGRKLVINTFPHRYDRRFARINDLAPRPAALDMLEARIRTEYGVAIDLDQFVRQRLADFEVGLRRYRELLSRAQPRLLLVSQNGIEKALFRAAREAGVPCVEVQHGLINGAHPAYAYPRSVGGEGHAMFPDVFFAFSQFWIDGCHYPARHQLPVGNDVFCPPRLPPPPAGGSVLVISAPKYHDALLRWLHLAAPLASDRHFVYKLHPSQATAVGTIRAQLADLANVSVRSTDVAVQALLAEARDVLLIQSTVAYEAVQAGRRLLVIPELDYDTHADLFPLKSVEVVADADALAAALARTPAASEALVFFKPFDASLSARVLEQLLATGKPPAPVAGATPSAAAR